MVSARGLDVLCIGGEFGADGDIFDSLPLTAALLGPQTANGGRIADAVVGEVLVVGSFEVRLDHGGSPFAGVDVEVGSALRRRSHVVSVQSLGRLGANLASSVSTRLCRQTRQTRLVGTLPG